MRSPKTKDERYAVVIVIFSVLMIFSCLGFVSSTASLFVVPVTGEMGIERSLYSIGTSIRYLTTAVVNLFFSALVARFGARRLVGVGFLSLAAAAVLSATASGLLSFYLAGVCLGVGFSFTTTTMVGYIVARWFPKRRGTVMGIILSANGLGGALAVQIVTPMIWGNMGWRNTYYFIAALLVVVGVLTVLFLRDAPRDYVERAITPKDGGAAEKKEALSTVAEPPSSLGYTVTVLVAVFFTGFILQGMSNVSVAHMTDAGIDKTLVSTVQSVALVCLLATKMLTGMLYDRFGLRTVACVSMVASILGAGALAFVELGGGGTLSIVLVFAYAVFNPVALPLETVMLPIYAREFFGERRFSQMLGILVSVNQVGYMLGGFVMNLVFDLLGSYRYAFLACMPAMAAVLVAVQLAITYGRKHAKPAA